MKVQQLLGILIKVKRILEVYPDSNLEDMLDDIYMKIKDPGAGRLKDVAAAPANEVSSAATKPSARKKNKNFDPVQTVEIIPRLSKEEIAVMLTPLKKAELQTVAILAGITIPGNVKRNSDIVDYIANFYGAKQLHQQMARR
ncbi:MAG: hypothetical protein ACOX6I_10990 [Syntrophomonadaceae bacterium]|jgi:hypothetical protein